MQKEKHKQRMPSSVTLEKMLESCPSLQAAETANMESHFYHLGMYKTRNEFDPFLRIHTNSVRRYRHKFNIEDYWANPIDEHVIR